MIIYLKYYSTKRAHYLKEKLQTRHNLFLSWDSLFIHIQTTYFYVTLQNKKQTCQGQNQFPLEKQLTKSYYILQNHQNWLRNSNVYMRGQTKLRLHYTSYVLTIKNCLLFLLLSWILLFLLPLVLRPILFSQSKKKRMLWVVSRVEEHILSSLCSPTGLSHILHKHAPWELCVCSHSICAREGMNKRNNQRKCSQKARYKIQRDGHLLGRTCCK